MNAPVSKKAEDAYTTALNVLLGKDSTHKFRISDTTVLFWAQQQNDFENQFASFSLLHPKMIQIRTFAK